MPAVYLALEWMHPRCLRMVAPPASHGSRTTEPAGGPRGRQEGCVLRGFLSLMQTLLVSSVFLSLSSTDPPEGGEWRPEQQGSEDH